VDYLSQWQSDTVILCETWRRSSTVRVLVEPRIVVADWNCSRSPVMLTRTWASRTRPRPRTNITAAVVITPQSLGSRWMTRKKRKHRQLVRFNKIMITSPRTMTSRHNPWSFVRHRDNLPPSSWLAAAGTIAITVAAIDCNDRVSIVLQTTH